MEIKYKKLAENAVEPKQAHPTDAGFDLTVTSKEFDFETGCIIYGTDIAVEIPEGHVGLLFPRSSIYKRYLFQTNSVGVIDSPYRGEIKVAMRTTCPFVRPRRLWNRIRAIFCKKAGKNYSVVVDNINSKAYEVGERIGQLIILRLPFVEFVEADELSDSDRGTGGYGSTGK